MAVDFPSTGLVANTTTHSGYTWNGSVWLKNSTSAITVQEEGSALSTDATTLNFVGTSVTATGTGATKTITISGSGGGGGSGASVSVSDTAPSSPSDGDLWYRSSDLHLYIYYCLLYTSPSPRDS